MSIWFSEANAKQFAEAEKMILNRSRFQSTWGDILQELQTERTQMIPLTYYPDVKALGADTAPNPDPNKTIAYPMNSNQFADTALALLIGQAIANRVRQRVEVVDVGFANRFILVQGPDNLPCPNFMLRFPNGQMTNAALCAHDFNEDHFAEVDYLSKPVHAQPSNFWNYPNVYATMTPGESAPAHK